MSLAPAAPPDVALLGIGLLGSAVAARLVAQDRCVRAYDPAPAARASQPTLAWTDSPAAAVSDAAFVVLCLPHSGVTAVLLPELLPALAPHAVVIDCTTGDPDEMAGFGARLAEHGRGYLDATVAGSSTLVRRGEVLVMAGGPAETLAAARPVLDAFVRRVVHAGPHGAGARLKLVLNMALGLHRAVLAETLHFADQLGIDLALALDVLRDGPAYSRVMDQKGERMLRREFAPEARLAQHHKDVRLMLKTGGAASALMPLTAVHDRLLERAEHLGYADADNSAIIAAYDAARGITA